MEVAITYGKGPIKEAVLTLTGAEALTLREICFFDDTIPQLFTDMPAQQAARKLVQAIFRRIPCPDV